MKPLRLGAAFLLFYYTYPTPSTIVGYMNLELKANKMDIMGTQFVNVTDDTLNIQNITVSNFTDGQDWMMVYTPGVGYETYIYGALVKDYETFEDDGFGWSVGDALRVQGVTLDPGQAFWINTQKDTVITIAGQVKMTESESVELVADKMDLIASPYPVATDIQKIAIANFTDGQDWMMIYTPGVGYETYIYGALVKDYETFEDDGLGWSVGDALRVQGVVLNPGQGFWINTKKDATITISR